MQESTRIATKYSISKNIELSTNQHKYVYLRTNLSLTVPHVQVSSAWKWYWYIVRISSGLLISELVTLQKLHTMNSIAKKNILCTWMLIYIYFFFHKFPSSNKIKIRIILLYLFLIYLKYLKFLIHVYYICIKSKSK